MKYRDLLIVTSLILLSLATGAAGQQSHLRNAAKYFDVGIQQDGKAIPINNHQASLQKKPFTLVFYLKQPDGILINAAVTPASFDRAQAGKPFEDIPGFSDLGMAEETFNPKVMLILSEHAPHYWYYENEANHRFNAVKREEGIFVCERIVANVLYREPTPKFVALKDMPDNALYLVFMRTEWTQDFRQQLERQREYVKIMFR